MDVAGPDPTKIGVVDAAVDRIDHHPGPVGDLVDHADADHFADEWDQGGCRVGPQQMAQVDFLEAGSGPLVVLVHGSLCGARQWRALMDDLKGRFSLRAPNLFGYGRTPARARGGRPSLSDFAHLAAAAVPTGARAVSIVGQSFGGAVAMEAAKLLGNRVERLVLLEPSLFYLLDACGRREAYAEIIALAEDAKQSIAGGKPEAGAERFIDYWCGRSTWALTPLDKRAALVRMANLLLDEWAAVLTGETPAAAWRSALPAKTVVVGAAETALPSRELVEVPRELGFESTWIAEGGHMAPLTHPQLVNPVIAEFFDRRWYATAPNSMRCLF